MHPPRPQSRPSFTPAARQAALEARQAKVLLREAVDAPKVFVVRLMPPTAPFGWEIRRFGGIVLERSGTGFASVTLAQDAGEMALPARAVP